MSQQHEERSLSGDSRVVSIRTPGGLRLELNFNEYRLALLGLIDFNGDWDAFETAAGLVPGGAAKAAVIRERLRPLAGALDALVDRGIDPLGLLAARLWFRQESLQP